LAAKHQDDSLFVGIRGGSLSERLFFWLTFAQHAGGLATEVEEGAKGGDAQHDWGTNAGRSGLPARYFERLAQAPLGRSVTTALIGAGILGLLATLWSEWSKCRRHKVIYVVWPASDSVTEPPPPCGG
jgi:hypothetical protein